MTVSSRMRLTVFNSTNLKHYESRHQHPENTPIHNMAFNYRLCNSYHFHTLSNSTIFMGLLYIWTLLSGIAGMFVIWYVVFCYTNKLIATVFVSVIVAIIIMLTVSWSNKPTPEEIIEHTYKTLHV